eukprot:350592-Chlamydomonas_euryale.AAC.5
MQRTTSRSLPTSGATSAARSTTSSTQSALSHTGLGDSGLWCGWGWGGRIAQHADADAEGGGATLGVCRGEQGASRCMRASTRSALNSQPANLGFQGSKLCFGKGRRSGRGRDGGGGSAPNLNFLNPSLFEPLTF